MKILERTLITVFYTTLFSVMDMWANHWEWKRENAGILLAIATTISIIIVKEDKKKIKI